MLFGYKAFIVSIVFIAMYDMQGTYFGVSDHKSKHSARQKET